LTDLKIDRL